jgi:hypothetical protein
MPYHTLESFSATHVTADRWPWYFRTIEHAPLLKFQRRADLSLLAVTR